MAENVVSIAQGYLVKQKTSDYLQPLAEDGSLLWKAKAGTGPSASSRSAVGAGCSILDRFLVSTISSFGDVISRLENLTVVPYVCVRLVLSLSPTKNNPLYTPEQDHVAPGTPHDHHHQGVAFDCRSEPNPHGQQLAWCSCQRMDPLSFLFCLMLLPEKGINRRSVKQEQRTGARRPGVPGPWDFTGTEHFLHSSSGCRGISATTVYPTHISGQNTRGELGALPLNTANSH